MGELDYEVKRTDRGDACQIYHLNLLKRWNEGTSVGLAAVVSNEDDLGPEAALQNHPFALVSGGGGGGDWWLQAGGLTGLRRAVGVCGEGGVGRRDALRGERVRRRVGKQLASE